MKITNRLYVGLWSKLYVPTDDSKHVLLRRIWEFYIAWKTLK